MNIKNLRLLLIVSLIALAFGLGSIASQFLPPWISENLSLSSFFFPTIQRDPLAPNNPSGTLYVFATTATTRGNAGGRSGMNAICAAEDPSSHFCSLPQITTAFESTGVFFSNTFDSLPGAWLDSPTTNWSSSYTCGGWTSDDYLELGEFVSQYARHHSTDTCQTLLRVSCCKWIP